MAKNKNKTSRAPADKPRRLRLEYVEARTLTPNPANWRRHPPEQLSALEAVLRDESVGWAGAMLFNERTGRLIDGHGRLKSVKPDERVPVLIGSWSEEAEQRILLTLDPIAAMAQADASALAALADQADLSDGRLAGLVEELERMAREASDDAGEGKSAGSKGGKDQTCEEQWKIVVDCAGEAEQVELLERFQKQGLKCRALVG